MTQRRGKSRPGEPSACVPAGGSSGWTARIFHGAADSEPREFLLEEQHAAPVSHSHAPRTWTCPSPTALHTAPEAAECPAAELSQRTVGWTHDAAQLNCSEDRGSTGG